MRQTAKTLYETDGHRLLSYPNNVNINCLEKDIKPEKTSKMNMYEYRRIARIAGLTYLMLTIVVSCTQNDKSERVLFFDRNVVNTKVPELVCQISEDSILIGNIADFTILNDTSFVVTDGRGVYIYHISGVFIKKLGNKGEARGEMISPSLVFATSNFIYIWCSSQMKFLIFDQQGNFINELTGFKRAVKKFVVNPSDEILYIYTSGFLNESENKMFDIIDIFNIAENSSKKIGERCPEDEVLFTYRNSGGLCVDTDRLIYIHPGNLIIYDLDLNSDKTVRYIIDDKTFLTTKITSHVRDIMNDFPRLFDYLQKNSVVTGLFKDSGQFIILSEIGQLDPNLTNTKDRKVKVYIFDSSFNPNRTILFDYLSSTNIVIYANSLYFIDLILTDNDQILTLNRFLLSEE